jgi:hypothetical protein
MRPALVCMWPGVGRLAAVAAPCLWRHYCRVAQLEKQSGGLCRVWPRLPRAPTHPPLPTNLLARQASCRPPTAEVSDIT